MEYPSANRKKELEGVQRHRMNLAKFDVERVNEFITNLSKLKVVCT